MRGGEGEGVLAAGPLLDSHPLFVFACACFLLLCHKNKQTRGMGGKVGSARLPTIRSESKHERSITGTSDPNTTTENQSEVDSPVYGTRALTRGDSRTHSRTVRMKISSPPCSRRHSRAFTHAHLTHTRCSSSCFLRLAPLAHCSVM